MTKHKTTTLLALMVLLLLLRVIQTVDRDILDKTKDTLQTEVQDKVHLPGDIHLVPTQITLQDHPMVLDPEAMQVLMVLEVVILLHAEMRLILIQADLKCHLDRVLVVLSLVHLDKVHQDKGHQCNLSGVNNKSRNHLVDTHQGNHHRVETIHMDHLNLDTHHNIHRRANRLHLNKKNGGLVKSK